MKRTKSINLDRMRKSSVRAALKPLSLAITAATLVACGSSSREGRIYKDVSACIEANPTLTSQCQSAYQKAVSESARTGPKYKSENDCIADFGAHNCVQYRPKTGENWYMPALGGFLFAQALRSSGYYGVPMYTSYSRYSPMYDKWTTVDGGIYGRKRYGKSIRVPEKVFSNKKPSVTRTISRGGFGSKASAKARYGGSSSRSGWGS